MHLVPTEKVIHKLELGMIAYPEPMSQLVGEYASHGMAITARGG